MNKSSSKCTNFDLSVTMCVVAPLSPSTALMVDVISSGVTPLPNYSLLFPLASSGRCLYYVFYRIRTIFSSNHHFLIYSDNPFVCPQPKHFTPVFFCTFMTLSAPLCSHTSLHLTYFSLHLKKLSSINIDIKNLYLWSSVNNTTKTR